MLSEITTRRATCKSIKILLNGFPAFDRPDKLEEVKYLKRIRLLANLIWMTGKRIHAR
jgi:hypothetical protein